jgi:hypothetical protein
MPSRWVCVAIVTFWLGSNGWLLWKDVWPRLERGQPPPFTIDLVEEVQLDKAPQTAWTVMVASSARGPARETYRALTWVERESGGDLYVLHFRVSPILAPPPAGGKPRSLGLVESMASRCRVTPAGDLRDLEAEVVVRGVRASFRGEVRGDRFFGRYDVGGLFQGDLEPVPVAHHGAVFLPFHPVQRLHGLRPGQTWREPSVGLPAFGLDGSSVRVVQARVLPTPEMLPWKGKDIPCLVIEYADEDQTMRTWVEQDGGLVLKQEAVVGTEHWVLQRDR